MIFLTVGTQLAFDRMVRAVDEALATRPDLKVFAQVAGGQYRPCHMEYCDFLPPREFEQRFASATHIIGHAGMGTIIQALLQCKPVLIMPRRADLGEQRNDHQLATARRFGQRSGVLVAEDSQQTAQQIDALMYLADGHPISQYADEKLLQFISDFIQDGKGNNLEVLPPGRKQTVDLTSPEALADY